MSQSNPYQSPVEVVETPAEQPQLTPSGVNAKVGFKPFPVVHSDFKKRALTDEEIQKVFHETLIDSLKELDFKVVSGSVDFLITGEIVKVDFGNRFLRYLVPGLAGATNVVVRGEVQRPNKPAHSFLFSKRCYFGAFGGDSKEMIKQSLKSVATQIACEAAGVGSPNTNKLSMPTKIAIMLAISAVLLIAVIAAAIFYQLAQTMPTHYGGMRPDERWKLAPIVAAMIAISGLSLGTALTPSSILNSRDAIWFRMSFGFKSIWAIRLVMLLFTILPLGVVFMCYRAI
ncbi:hypothetical protein GC197_15795 [bacterium]|nr:hypothetical protein [bacterium]